MLCVPSSCATVSSAALIARSSAVRSHCPPKIVRPFSPVSRLCASSASVRSLPPASTSHGASARPARGGVRPEPRGDAGVGRRAGSVERGAGEGRIHTFVAGHGDDLALEGALEDVPLALVDAERGLAVIARVLVRLGHDPRRRVLARPMDRSQFRATSREPGLPKQDSRKCPACDRLYRQRAARQRRRRESAGRRTAGRTR